MDHDSPDWDRTPTESIEVKDEAPHTTKAEPVEPPTNETKLELMKKEEDSPQHTPMLCPPVRTVPDKTSTTSTSPPPKPPLFPTHLTGIFPHALRHRPTPRLLQHHPQLLVRISQHHPHHPLPHPPPALRILSSSPPMFPSCRKHVRGTHQSIPIGWAPHSYTTLHIQQHPHASPYKSPFHAPTGMANFYPSTFPLTSNTTSIPRHTPPDDPPHQAQHRPLTSNQPLPQIPLQCTPHSRRPTHRATSCHAPADYPADCSSGRRCSRGRTQFTIKQLVVSPHTILTHRVMTRKEHGFFRFVTSSFQLSLTTVFNPQSTLTRTLYHHAISFLTAAVFQLVIFTTFSAQPPLLPFNGECRRLR